LAISETRCNAASAASAAAVLSGALAAELAGKTFRLYGKCALARCLISGRTFD
jgi:hypothetical protein